MGLYARRMEENMRKERRQEYSARVVQAKRTELLVIVYEIIQEELELAMECFEEKDLMGFDAALKNAQKFLNELMATLDYQYEISYQLMSIYKFTNKILIEDRIKKTDACLEDCIRIFQHLKDGYQGIVSQDDSAPAMENVQKIYAGLTYGKSSLYEISVDVKDGKRGIYA